MYLNLVRRWWTSLHQRVWKGGLMRSGMVTWVILGALVLGLGFAYTERGRGHLSKLKVKMGSDDALQVAPPPQPGGQEAITLTRTRQLGGSIPEFLTATVLPGRGMNVLQIRVYLPDKGEVNLLASPSVEGAERAMTGMGLDANGGASMTMGGAVEAPWAGSMAGVPSQMPDHISAAWRGHIMTLPTDEDGTVAKNGTMLAEGAESATMTAMPDGGQVRAVFKAQNFGVRWPSQTEMTVSVLMSARTLELTVVAHNTGDVPEPIGIGWHPRFALLGGSRQQVTLRAPGRMRVELRDRNNGLPTGNLIPVAGTAYDYTQHDGAKLGDNSVDETFVDLHQNLLDSGPTAELIDPANDYGLRLTVLSPTIKALRVEAPADGEYVALTPQFNYPDPFGHEWANEGDTGMVVLQPGQSTQWKVRLELISMTSHAAPL